MLGENLITNSKTVKWHFVQARKNLDDLDNKVDIWEHQQLKEEVWDLQRELDKLREEFEKFKELLTGDGK
jgi:predicted kinase